MIFSISYNRRFLAFCTAVLFTAAANATLNEAITTGNRALLPADSTETLNAALQQIDTYQSVQSSKLAAFYPSPGAITYAPGNRTQLISIEENEAVFPLLMGNKGNILAVNGSAGGGRFAAYGSVPMSYFLSGNNLSYEAPFKRVLGWLFSGVPGDIASFSQAKNIALTYTGGESTKITQWLNQKAPTWKTQVCNDPATISACYQNKDFLIVSWETNANASANVAVLSAIKTHLALKKPVLYLHTWYEATSSFSDLLTKFFGISLPYGGNYWANDAANFNSLSQMQTGNEAFGKIERLLRHFQAQNYSFNWNLCADDRDCKNMPDLVSEFYDGAEAVRQQVGSWEKKNLDIFSQNGRRLGKLLVLLGDKYRSVITYPMTKGVTNDTTFLQSLYADHSAYLTRKINPSQPDLGSFSDTIPSNLPILNPVLSLVTRRSQASSSSGYYVPPGRTITLTRTDASPVRVYVHVGMLRSGAAHVFDTYDRPLYLWSTNIPLVLGKTVKITSPYGGILYLNAEGSETVKQVSVASAGLLRQPVFNGTNFDEFSAKLASTPLNWAEIRLPAIQIHSRLDLMKESVNDPLIGGYLKRLLVLTQNYLYKDIYGLAGMVGAGIVQPAKVLAFCTAHGWDCTSVGLHGMTNIQHINADRAYCGYGCSGNPYDQYWAFTPLGWGESHEIGHNLQRSRLKIYDSASTEVSNNIFPTHKWWRFNKLTTETVKYGRDLGFKATFDTLQLAAKSADPVESARLAIWVNGGVFQRLVFYWQMAMNSRSITHLGDAGWDVFRLMYIHERLFSAAIASDSAWTNQRASLGFTQYAQRPTAINGNDFMLIAMSFITGKDQRPFFNMWGVKYNTEASNQVAAYGFTPVKKQFWVVPNEASAFKDPLPTPVLINGVSPWPL